MLVLEKVEAQMVAVKAATSAIYASNKPQKPWSVCVDIYSGKLVSVE